MNKPLKIGKLLKKGPLSSLLAQARIFSDLETQIQALLPLSLQPHCHVMSLRNKELVLAADSPVWAARLRFHAPKLIKQLSRRQAASVSTVRVRVSLPEKSTTSAGVNPFGQRQGRVRASALTQAAQNVSDPQLKSALLRLSRR